MSFPKPFQSTVTHALCRHAAGLSSHLYTPSLRPSDRPPPLITASVHSIRIAASSGAATPRHHAIAPIDPAVCQHAPHPRLSLTNTPESDHKSTCKVSQPAAISNAQSYHRVLPLQALAPQHKPANTADQGADPHQYSSKKTVQRQEPQPV